MTTYVVLRRDEADGAYTVIVPRVEANSDLIAVRRAVAGLNHDLRTGEFVAVPVRSFRTRKLLVETVQKELWQ